MGHESHNPTPFPNIRQAAISLPSRPARRTSKKSQPFGSGRGRLQRHHIPPSLAFIVPPRRTSTTVRQKTAMIVAGLGNLVNDTWTGATSHETGSSSSDRTVLSGLQRQSFSTTARSDSFLAWSHTPCPDRKIPHATACLNLHAIAGRAWSVRTGPGSSEMGGRQRVAIPALRNQVH